MLAPVVDRGLTVTEDALILATAIAAQKQQYDLIFVTIDLCLKTLAKFFIK